MKNRKILLKENYTQAQLDHFSKFITCFGNRDTIKNKDHVSISFSTSFGPAKSPVQEEIIRIMEIMQITENPHLLNEEWLTKAWNTTVNAAKRASDYIGQKTVDGINYVTGNNLWATISGTFYVRLIDLKATLYQNPNLPAGTLGGHGYKYAVEGDPNRQPPKVANNTPRPDYDNNLSVNVTLEVGIRYLKLHTALNPNGTNVVDRIPLSLNANAIVNFKVQTVEGQSKLILTPTQITTPVGDTKITKQNNRIVVSSKFGQDLPGFGRTGFFIEGDSCLTVNMFGYKYTLKCFGDSVQAINSIFSTNSNTLLSAGTVERAFDPKVPLSDVFTGLKCNY